MVFQFCDGSGHFDGKNNSDLKSQFRASMSNIGNIAKSVGKPIRDIARMSLYLSDKSYFQLINQVFAEYSKESRPARTALVTGFVAIGIFVESDAILH